MAFSCSGWRARGCGPGGVAVTPDGKTAFVANRASDTVSTVKTRTQDPTGITVGANPNGMQRYGMRAIDAARSRPRQRQCNTSVIIERDSSDFVMVILDGRIKVVVTDADGNESLLIRGPSEMVGELAAFDSNRAR